MKGRERGAVVIPTAWMPANEHCISMTPHGKELLKGSASVIKFSFSPTIILRDELPV